MLITRPDELIELLISRTVGALPASGCLSLVTVTVAVKALPAFAADGIPFSAMFRSLASAAGTAASAAIAARTISLRILPPSVAQPTPAVSPGFHRTPNRGSAGARARSDHA